MASELRSVFQSKYDEFCDDLVACLPEFEAQIAAARVLTLEQRLARFSDEVLPNAAPNRDPAVCPATVLPGVTITAEIWSELSGQTKSAIQEYLTLLSISCLFETGKGKDSSFFNQADGWMDDFMKNMKTKMSSMDFESMAKKMATLFGFGGTEGAEGSGPALPKLPEKFLKGHLAKLAEEIMRDFNPSDLGLDEETIKKCEADPSNAFGILMEIYQKNPNFIMNSVQKIGKRLQAKIQNGSINPATIVAEAEELMKSFSENPAFGDLMETFRGMFSMDELTKAPGQVGVSARRAMINERLKKKLAQRQAQAPVQAQNTIVRPSGGGAGGGTPQPIDDSWMNEPASGSSKKKGRK
jgi:hypothetical protein